MSLERTLERIATALETLAAQGVGKAPDARPESKGKAEQPNTPPAVVTATQETPANVELDKEGLPWDERIHSGSKSRMKSGCWTKKRQVDPELVATVETELRDSPQPSASPQGVQTQGTQTTGPMTLPELQIAAQDICRELGPRLNEVGAVLQQYGVAELSKLQPAQYANFLEAIKGLLDAPA